MPGMWFLPPPAHVLHYPPVLELVLRSCAVTVSSTGAKKQLQGDDNGHVGSSPHAHSFVIGPAVINTHTHTP